MVGENGIPQGNQDLCSTPSSFPQRSHQTNRAFRKATNAQSKGTSVSHVVFVDSRPNGFPALTAAKLQGHRVTFVASAANQRNYEGPAFEDVSSKIDRLVGVTDARDPARLRTALEDISRDLPVDALIATQDDVVSVLGPVASDLGIRYTAPDGIRNARNKDLAYALLAEAGLATPEQIVVEDPARVPEAVERIGFPCVVKPASGFASIAASIVHGPADLAAARDKIARAAELFDEGLHSAVGTRLVVERYLEGPLMSVEVAAAEGVCTPLAVLERQRHHDDLVMELGSLAPARLSPAQDAAVRSYACDAAKALGLDLGVFHLEVIHTADGPMLIDPNPRMVGGPNPLVIRHCWGVDIFDVLVSSHLGKATDPVASTPLRYGGAHVLAPAADSRHRPGADLSFLDREPGVLDWQLRTTPGQPVQRATSNVHYVGHVLSLGDSHDEVVKTSVAAVDRLTDQTGIPFITWR